MPPPREPQIDRGSGRSEPIDRGTASLLSAGAFAISDGSASLVGLSQVGEGVRGFGGVQWRLE